MITLTNFKLGLMEKLAGEWGWLKFDQPGVPSINFKNIFSGIGNMDNSPGIFSGFSNSYTPAGLWRPKNNLEITKDKSGNTIYSNKYTAGQISDINRKMLIPKPEPKTVLKTQEQANLEGLEKFRAWQQEQKVQDRYNKAPSVEWQTNGNRPLPYKPPMWNP